MSMLRTVSSILLTLIAVSGFAADIIIESRGQNVSGYQETEGHWLTSNNPIETAKSAAPGLTPPGEGSRKATVAPPPGATPDQVISAARFTPKIETPGDYNVYVTFPKAANATPVTIYVKHANGEDKKDISQDGWGITGAVNANRWIEIGKYPFTAAGDQYVEVRVTGKTGPVDPKNPPQAYADAVRFSTEPVSTAAAVTAAAPAAPGETGSSAGPTATDNSPLQWTSDLASGRAAATAAGKKVFVFFYSPQSSRSTDYEKKVINDPKVKAVINAGFVPVKIDMDSERQLSSQLQVFRAGTINVYDGATGSGLEHISDTPEADELVKRLNAVK